MGVMPLLFWESGCISEARSSVHHVISDVGWDSDASRGLYVLTCNASVPRMSGSCSRLVLELPSNLVIQCNTRIASAPLQHRAPVKYEVP